MLTALVLGFVALIAFAYVAVPLVVPGQADPLPDDRDPVLLDLEEEKTALLRAIRELDAREDLSAERREHLRARYEAKAAAVLRAIDERDAELAGRARPARPRGRRVPFGALVLLVLVVASAAVLPGTVLPRVGDQSTATTTDVDAAQQLQTLQRAAERDPSADNLLALGDAYWNLDQPDEAEAAYQKVVDTVSPVPAAAYKRLAFLYLQKDLDKAAGYLEQARAADPQDGDTLFAVGEVAFAQGDLAKAKEAYQAFLKLPGNEGDAQVQERLALIDEAQPLIDAVQADPSEANLMALGDLYWSKGEQDRAVDLYFRVVTGPDPNNATALSRTAQLLFLRGRSADAVGVFAKAAEAAGGASKLDQDSLLMYGNAYFSQQDYQDAIDVWTLYVDNAGGDDQAGRVPDLIASARARMEGGTDAAAAGPADGQQLYQANCAACHGAAGQGEVGPPLAGNPRAQDASNVTDAVRFGRGVMPGFQAQLTQDQIDALVQFVTDVLAPSGG